MTPYPWRRQFVGLGTTITLLSVFWLCGVHLGTWPAFWLGFFVQAGVFLA